MPLLSLFSKIFTKKKNRKKKKKKEEEESQHVRLCLETMNCEDFLNSNNAPP
jgi:hypothetical protein